MQLAVWNLTQFDRIVYLDSDVLALENPDVLFQCSGFCAQVSKSKSEGEAFNRYVLAVCMRYLKLFFFFNGYSGVLVLEPSERLYEALRTNISQLHSYDGADQGYLYSFFSDFSRERQLFEPCGTLCLSGHVFLLNFAEAHSVDECLSAL